MKKYLILPILLMALSLCFLSACDGSNPPSSDRGSESVSSGSSDNTDSGNSSSNGNTDATPKPCSKHTFGEWETVKESNCGTQGEKRRSCTLCGHPQTSSLPKQGEHSYGDPGKCLVCGNAMDENFLFTKNADGESYSFGYAGTASSVTVPATYNEMPVTALVDYAFADSYTLKSVRLPDSIVAIGTGAFAHCTSLTSVNTPSSLKTIGSEAFSGCDALTSFKLPEGIERIEYGTFMNSGLKSVSLPKSLTYIGEDAFNSCTALTSVKIPSSVSMMESGAFSACRALKEVTIENGSKLKEIPRNAFSSNQSLNKVTIGEGVEVIGSGAFSSTLRLGTLSLPSTLKSMGEKAFYNCADSLNIKYNGTMSDWEKIEDASPDNWVREDITVVNIYVNM